MNQSNLIIALFFYSSKINELIFFETMLKKGSTVQDCPKGIPLERRNSSPIKILQPVTKNKNFSFPATCFLKLVT
jgi:hypothetical protein